MDIPKFIDLKNFLGLSEDSIYDYPALPVIRESAISGVESYLYRELEQKERVETRLLRSDTRITLKALPIIEVSSFTVDDVEISTDSYQLEKYGLQMLIPQIGAAEITYTGGYLEEDIPDEIYRAILIQTVYEFQNKERVGAESITTEGGTVSTRGTVLLNEVKRLLNRFKHPVALV